MTHTDTDIYAKRFSLNIAVTFKSVCTVKPPLLMLGLNMGDHFY